MTTTYQLIIEQPASETLYIGPISTLRIAYTGRQYLAQYLPSGYTAEVGPYQPEPNTRYLTLGALLTQLDTPLPHDMTDVVASKVRDCLENLLALGMTEVEAAVTMRDLVNELLEYIEDENEETPELYLVDFGN